MVRYLCLVDLRRFLKSLAIFLFLSTVIGMFGITNESDQFVVVDPSSVWMDRLTVDAHVDEGNSHKYTVEKDFTWAPCADILPHGISGAKH